LRRKARGLGTNNRVLEKRADHLYAAIFQKDLGWGKKGISGLRDPRRNTIGGEEKKRGSGPSS